MKTIREIEYLEGVKVLVRVDYNVPLKNGAVLEDYRVRMSLPTIEYLCGKGAKVILMSHLETNEGEKATLAPVSDVLRRLGVENTFVGNLKQAHQIIDHQLGNGEVVLLENLRDHAGEKKNDAVFAKELASLADIYINEAFSVCHREHASVVGVPEFLPGYAGFQLEKEIANLSRVFEAAHPFVFVLGGAKFETKLPLLKRFIDLADVIFVGGALACDIFKAQGLEVGLSKVSTGAVDLSAYVNNARILLPVDFITKQREVKDCQSLLPTDAAFDSGPRTLDLLKTKIADARFILWNGPLGVFEEGFKEATLELAKMIAQATARGAETVLGGGDTLAAIAELNIEDQFTFVSTGGGAMLDFLAHGTLPGIAVLK